MDHFYGVLCFFKAQNPAEHLLYGKQQISKKFLPLVFGFRKKVLLIENNLIYNKVI